MTVRTVVVLPLLLAGAAFAQSAPTSSLLVRRAAPAPAPADRTVPHALRDLSLFALAPEPPRDFQKHDLVQIVVRETSRAESTHETDGKKSYDLNGSISAWPHLSLADILQLQLAAGNSTDLPKVGVKLGKNFKGDAEYKREDDFTARLTAEVIDILPNGNLVLEARTHITNDREDAVIKVTGICRPDDVNAANTVLSTQIHDLRVEKRTSGELRDTNEKGIITKFFDFLFAF